MGVSCSTKLPKAGVKAFHSCDYEKAISVFDKKVRGGGKDKDFVLYNMALLSSAVYAGQYEIAEKASLNAQRVMWSDAGKGRGQASLVSAEALKIFKGEPFEKSMASVYSGIIYYNRGDLDNANAAFSKASLAVQLKKDTEHRQDFALVNFLRANVLLKQGEDDNATIALKRARTRFPQNPLFTIKTLKENNTVFLVELGVAPKKARSGPGASLVQWQRYRYPERDAMVYVDGQKIGRTFLSGDLTYQAQTKGWTGKDTIQVTKGATREAAAVTTVIAANEAARGNETAGWVALGAGLFALANQSQADVRQWSLLPDLLHVQVANLIPGRHEIRVEFVDGRNRVLPEYTQTWYTDTEVKSPNRVFLFRSRPCHRGGSLDMEPEKTSDSQK